MSALSGVPAGRSRRRRERTPRTGSFKVRVSQREREGLQLRAAALGVSVPRLLVESALSGVETPAERRAWMAELFELRRLVATVANNVNQLAKVANTTGELPAAGRLSGTLGEVRELLVVLREWTGARR